MSYKNHFARLSTKLPVLLSLDFYPCNIKCMSKMIFPVPACLLL